jgi:hypothetical protein
MNPRAASSRVARITSRRCWRQPERSYGRAHAAFPLRHLVSSDRDWGCVGVFSLMAVESTVFPIPSEVIVLPAAYRARQGGLNFWGVVAASTPGSWFGSSLSCWFAYVVGRPLILKYGGYFGVPEKKGLARRVLDPALLERRPLLRAAASRRSPPHLPVGGGCAQYPVGSRARLPLFRADPPGRSSVLRTHPAGRSRCATRLISR